MERGLIVGAMCAVIGSLAVVVPATGAAHKRHAAQSYESAVARLVDKAGADLRRERATVHAQAWSEELARLDGELAKVPQNNPAIGAPSVWTAESRADAVIAITPLRDVLYRLDELATRARRNDMHAPSDDAEAFWPRRMNLLCAAAIADGDAQWLSRALELMRVQDDGSIAAGTLQQSLVVDDLIGAAREIAGDSRVTAAQLAAYLDPRFDELDDLRSTGVRIAREAAHTIDAGLSRACETAELERGRRILDACMPLLDGRGATLEGLVGDRLDLPPFSGFTDAARTGTMAPRTIALARAALQLAAALERKHASIDTLLELEALVGKNWPHDPTTGARFAVAFAPGVVTLSLAGAKPNSPGSWTLKR